MDTTDRMPATEQLPLPTLLALFLIPGALITIAFVLLAPVIDAAGFPPIAALLVAILVVLVPFELGVRLAGQPGPGHPLGHSVSSAAFPSQLAVAGAGPHRRGVRRFWPVDGD